MLKKILPALLIVVSLCGASWADIIYATSDGKLGIITVSTSSDILEPFVEYESGITDPYLLSYWNGTASSVMLIQNNATASGDRAYTFSASDLSVLRSSRDINGVFGGTNADYSDNGRSIYLSSGPTIFEVSTSDFSIVHSYDCNRILSRDGEVTEVESLALDYSTVNVIISAGDARRYARFDGQLKEGVTYFMSRDIEAGSSYIDIVNDVVLISHSSGVSGRNFRNEFAKILSTDNPVVATCGDDERGVYYAERTSADNEYIFTLSNSANSSTTTKFDPVDIPSAEPYISLMREETKNLLAVMTAEGIRIYDIETGILLQNFGTSILGGKPVGIGTASAKGSSSSSSSGCNSLGASMIMLMLIGALMKRK